MRKTALVLSLTVLTATAASAQTEFDADLALDEWDATIGDKIMNGEIRIYSELQSESTTLLISVFSSGNGNGEVYFTRDYTLRQ